jgi:hypothetical protein
MYSSFQVMSSSIAHGYKIPHNDTTLFLSYGKDAPIPGNWGVMVGTSSAI